MKIPAEFFIFVMLLSKSIMISVYIYNNYLPEKKYIFDYVFGEIFRCEFELIPCDEKFYRITDNRQTVVFRDHFFAELEEGVPYFYNKDMVPQRVVFADYPEQDIFKVPVIFGNAEIRHEKDLYFIQNDIFAGLFFMLTRWEEIAIAKFDEHGRFVEEENLSVRCGFYERPVVNDYLKLLEKVLLDIGIIKTGIVRKRNYFITHDVDEIERYHSFHKILKALVGDIVKRKSLKTFFKTLKDCYNIKIKHLPDVYDTFDWLMDISNKKGLISRFYFIPGYKGEKDVRYDVRSSSVMKITEKIKSAGHIIGIHPSYSTFCNKEQLSTEKERLSEYCKDISEGRQHYLRFGIPDTWQDWEDSNLKYDSSVGFYNRVGFRAGICFEYPVFNVKTRKQLNIRERPLMVMDTALKKQCVSKEISLSAVVKLLEESLKYGGDFVLLWHNSNLKVNEWCGWDQVYKQILEKI